MTTRTVGIEWHVRRLMAERGLYSTTDLMPLLVARGVTLSATQVYRLVTQTPERLNVRVLAAMCDALECTPADLIEVTITKSARRSRATTAQSAGTSGPRPVGRPRRVKLVDD